MKPTFPDKITIGDKYGPAMQITDPAEALEYYEACVEHTMRVTEQPALKSREAAEKCERENLGYYAGYYDVTTQERVEKLFGAAHPVFGSTKGPQMTAQEVFDRGVAEGMKGRP